MKHVFSALTVLVAALLVTACTKCSQDKPVEPPPVVEPPQGTPPPTEGATTGDVSGAPAADEAAPAK
jgi:hypothetical protein